MGWLYFYLITFFIWRIYWYDLVKFVKNNLFSRLPASYSVLWFNNFRYSSAHSNVHHIYTCTIHMWIKNNVSKLCNILFSEFMKKTFLLERFRDIKLNSTMIFQIFANNFEPLITCNLWWYNTDTMSFPVLPLRDTVE